MPRTAHDTLIRCGAISAFSAKTSTEVQKIRTNRMKKPSSLPVLCYCYFCSGPACLLQRCRAQVTAVVRLQVTSTAAVTYSWASPPVGYFDNLLVSIPRTPTPPRTHAPIHWKVSSLLYVGHVHLHAASSHETRRKCIIAHSRV